MVQSKDGVRHTMRCGNRCIYNLLKAFGWSLVLLLAISYVFLFLTVTHSIHTPSSVPLWYLIYLVVFFVGGFYMAIDISEILFCAPLPLMPLTLITCHLCRDCAPILGASRFSFPTGLGARTFLGFPSECGPVTATFI